MAFLIGACLLDTIKFFVFFFYKEKIFPIKICNYFNENKNKKKCTEKTNKIKMKIKITSVEEKKKKREKKQFFGVN